MKYPLSIARLIEELIKLPGIGPRSAERIVFHLLKVPAPECARLAEALAEVKKRSTTARSATAWRRPTRVPSAPTRGATRGSSASSSGPPT